MQVMEGSYCVLWEFSYITTYLKRYNFIELLQIVFYGKNVEIKIKSMLNVSIYVHVSIVFIM